MTVSAVEWGAFLRSLNHPERQEPFRNIADGLNLFDNNIGKVDTALAYVYYSKYT